MDLIFDILKCSLALSYYGQEQKGEMLSYLSLVSLYFHFNLLKLTIEFFQNIRIYIFIYQ